MNKVVLLEATLLLAITDICHGITFSPNAFTFNDVSSINGSDSNAGCPSVCRMTGASNERFCDCTGMLTDTSGVLIDGIIPTFDVTQRGTWASQLYTVNTAATSYTVGFQFSSPVMLREVELYLFFCPHWNIPGRLDLTINVYRTLAFPSFIAPTLIGTLTLNNEMSNCNSLIKISIAVQTSARSIYFLDFTSAVPMGGIYFGEVIFRNEVQAVTSTLIPLTISFPTSIVLLSTVSSITTQESSYETLSTASTHATIASTFRATPPLLPTMAKTSKLFTDEATTVESSIDYVSILLTTDIISNSMNSITQSTSNSPLVHIVGALLGVIVCMAIVMIVRGTVCVIAIVKKRRPASIQHNFQQEQSVDDVYEYIRDFNEAVEQDVIMEMEEAANRNEIELMKNTAYDVVKMREIIKNEGS